MEHLWCLWHLSPLWKSSKQWPRVCYLESIRRFWEVGRGSPSWNCRLWQGHEIRLHWTRPKAALESTLWISKILSETEGSKTNLWKKWKTEKAAIEKLKKNYGKAIRNNVKREITTTEERDQAVQSTKTEILDGLFHCLKLPNKKGISVVKIYDRLTDSALLARCLPGHTQNVNESINSLVWNKCPKHKWHHKRRVQLAASSAALHFSGGASTKHAVIEKVGLTVSDSAKMEARRRDSERVKQA